MSFSIRSEMYILPTDQDKLNDILNDDLIVVTRKDIVPCPKDVLFMVYVEYEDHREEVN